MLTITRRPMTPEERTAVEQVRRFRSGAILIPSFAVGGWRGCLAALLASSISCLTLLVAIPIACFLFSALIAVLLGVLLDWLGVPDPVETIIVTGLMWVGSIAGFLVGLFLYVAVLGIELPSPAERRAIDRDLAENQAEVLHYTVLDAVEVEGDEDTGPGYFLDLGDSTLLYLQGQYVEELVDEHRFPNREFRLVRTPYAQIPLGFDCLGEPFEPSREVDPFTGDVHRRTDGEILSGRLETLDADLLRIEQERRRRNARGRGSTRE